MFGLALNATARCSITNTYRRGESGHPWHVPLEMVKEEESDPFTRGRMG